MHTGAGGTTVRRKRRVPGFGKPSHQREEPREIGPYTAAPEPLTAVREQVRAHNNVTENRRQSNGGVQSANLTIDVPRRQGKNVRRPSEDYPRRVVNDRLWRSARPFLVCKRGRNPKNLRRTFEGILHIFRTGVQWRDLPPYFGKWNSVYQAFRRMCQRGVFVRMFMSLAKELDLKVVMVDGSFVKVHQHAAGARRGELTPEESRKAQAIGKTKGGLNTLLLALADKNGKLASLSLLPGNTFEAHHLAGLFEGLATAEIEELLGDKAYDTNAVRDLGEELGIEITVPSKSSRKEPIPYDEYRYKGRHLVENLFVDLKHFRGVSTRYHKLAETFCAGLHLVTWFMRRRERKERSSKYL